MPQAQERDAFSQRIDAVRVCVRLRNFKNVVESGTSSSQEHRRAAIRMDSHEDPVSVALAAEANSAGLEAELAHVEGRARILKDMPGFMLKDKRLHEHACG